MPYRLNNYDTLKIANPDRRETVKRHRYRPHYYMCGNGDVYLVYQHGHLYYVGFDCDDREKIWCPHGDFEIQDWQPIVQGGGLCAGELKPLTYTDLIIMTGIRSCIYLRRGMILYEGWYDGRGMIAEKRPYTGDNEPISVTMSEIPVWLKDKNGKYTAKDSQYEKWISFNKTYQRGMYDRYVEQCKSDEHTSRYGNSDVDEDGKPAGIDSITVPQTGHLSWRCINVNPDADIEPPSECYRVPANPDVEADSEVTWNVHHVWGLRKDQVPCDEELEHYQWMPCFSKDCTLIAKEETDAGARLINIGGGFALFPYTWQIPNWKTHTWLAECNSGDELPGYEGMHDDGYIITDWEACRKYKVKQDASCAEPVNPDAEPEEYEYAVVRTGLQEGDCFYHEATDQFWRLEFNGWKEYDEYNETRYGFGCHNRYVVILPTMVTPKSAEHHCKPRWIVHGANK